MILTDEQGKQWEFVGYGSPIEGQQFLDTTEIRPFVFDRGTQVRALFRPFQKVHKFGGVKFRETGEVRQVREGEWYLTSCDALAPSYWPRQRVTVHEFPILEVI